MHCTVASITLVFIVITAVYGEFCITECEVPVNIDSGPVCGREETAENNTKYYSFQGIPYAKPPVGSKRFAELEPIESWSDPFYAYEEGPACPSRDLVYGSITVKPKGMSEDCIYVNVFVPATACLDCDCLKDDLLPILVNIHGGTFNTGSGNRDLHGPELLMVKNVIVINFNFRLAVFGYLSLASGKIPGNNSLRDMVTLLQWVQRNARAFGGDPRRVTLLGESSGAASVHLLMLSQAARGLFEKGIIMSGSAMANFYTASPIYAKMIAEMFLQELGLNCTDPDEIHKTLTELPLEDIMRANDVVQYKTGPTSFAPVVEIEDHEYTRIIDDDPIALIAQGRAKDIPLLMGFNRDEGEFAKWIIMILDVVNRYKSNPAIILGLRLAYALPSEEAFAKGRFVGKRYFDGEPTLDGLAKSMTDILFQYSMIKLAQWRVLLRSAPTYFYLFSYESDFSSVKRANWLSYKGTAHVEDLTYVFRTTTFLRDHVSIPPQTRDDHMRDWMSTLFSNYVKCNNPTCTELDDPRWPPTDMKELMYQVIREPHVYNMSTLSDELMEMVEFVDSVDDQVRTQTEILQEQYKETV
ncbi:juvenile hormone esterase [Bombyx mori]|uniref:Carboxylic ester hydrolase n=1 Tax=Bombyx mori TaxID=7091 RepID=A0A8R2G9M4_BOMMO|nr:juvenile hormone esterase isoform X1 [Bombyx mori]